MNGRASEPQAPARGISLRDFAAVVFRRKWIVLSVLVIATAITTVAILSRPTYYESTGKVLVRRGLKDNLYGYQDRVLSWTEDLASEQEMARSAVILREAQRILDDKRRSEGRPRFAINLPDVEAGVVGESNVLGISYRDRDPGVCVEVTNVLLTAYTEYRKRVYAVDYPAEFFLSKAKGMEDQMAQLQERRRRLLLDGGLVGGDEDRQQMLNLNSLQQLAAQEIERDIVRMSAEVEQMRAYLASPNDSLEVPVGASVGESSGQVIAQIKGDLVRAGNRLTELSAVYTQDAPEIVQVKQQITALRAALEAEIRTWVRVAEGDLAAKRAQLAAADQRQAETEQRIVAYPEQEAVLSDIERQMSAVHYTYKELTDRASLAQVQKATSAEWTVLILSPASPPYVKNKQDYIRIVLAPVFSLLVGLGLAFFIDSLDTSIRTARQVESAVELPVLATLAECGRR